VKKINRLHLVVILVFSLLIRFVQISRYPIHLSMDEAAITYNAYSIAKTGKDEWNQKFPLAFKSAGDYKPPVAVYLTAPVVYVFGLNEFSSRFVSALLGGLTPFILYLLLIEIKINPKPSFFTSLWLAVLPWHIHFSRASFEAITALFFFVTGLYFWLKWLKHRHWSQLFFFVIAFSLSVWSYHAERLYVPLVTFYLFLSRRKSIIANLKKTNSKHLILIALVFLIFTLPFLKLTFFTPAITNRAASTSILRESSLANSLHQNYHSLTEKIFDNNLFLILQHWFNKYLSYFDFRFLFWKGLQFTPPQHPDLGILLPLDIIIIAIGLFHLINHGRKNHLYLFTALFFLGPLPASLTMNYQHPLRALTWLPAFFIPIAYSFEYLTKIKWQKIILASLFIFYITSLVFFVNIYTRLFPFFFSEYWQYGYKQASEYACQHQNEYAKIIISDTFGSDGPLNTGLPYLYVLLACNYPPEIFQQTRNTGKIQYRRADWAHDQYEKDMLIVATPWDILDEHINQKQIIKTINYKNGKTAFLLIKTNEN